LARAADSSGWSCSPGRSFSKPSRIACFVIELIQRRSTGLGASELFGGTPNEAPLAYRVANPITYIERVCAPLLVTVGRNDPRCPARSVDVYTARLRELGIPFSEYRYDAGHGSVVVAEQIKQLALQLDFAATHFGTTPALA